MPNVLTIDSLEQLAPFANDKSLIEIVIRKKNKRFKEFQNILIRNLTKKQEQNMVKDALEKIGKKQGLIIKNLDFLTKQSQLSLLLSGLNLCSTLAGFAILHNEVKNIGNQISQQINQLSNDIKQGNDTQTTYRFNQVLASHTDMLDRQRLQRPYSEEKLLELVEQEYIVLSLLIDHFMKGISKDQNSLVFSIFSLLSMFTVTLMDFDEIYYENNHQQIVQAGGTVWHPSHNKWMGVYSRLLEQEFIEKLQDFTIFEKGLSLFDADNYYISLLDQVISLRQEIEANQQLVPCLTDAKLLHQVNDCIDASVRDSINEVFNNSNVLENQTIKEALNESLQQMAL